jgi:hypothetical protein
MPNTVLNMAASDPCHTVCTELFASLSTVVPMMVGSGLVARATIDLQTGQGYRSRMFAAGGCAAYSTSLDAETKEHCPLASGMHQVFVIHQSRLARRDDEKSSSSFIQMEQRLHDDVFKLV